jgi:hypothetical protein
MTVWKLRGLVGGAEAVSDAESPFANRRQKKRADA